MEIYINGEIYNNMVEKESLQGEITVHVNSLGGDVFEALAIYNKLKTCNAKCIIEGVCGSAATLIACGCKSVTMRENSLYMVHDPSVELWSSYTQEELEKVKNSLEKVRDEIMNIYVSRTGKSLEEIDNIMKAETWYSAAEAVAAGFADNIEGVADTELENDILISNKIKFSCNKYDRNKIVAQINKREHILAAERLRIKNLTARKCGNEYIDALIDEAIENGDTVDKIEKYIEALGKVKVTDKLSEMIADNLNSGVEGVLGEGEKLSPEDIRVRRIAAFANGRKYK